MKFNLFAFCALVSLNDCQAIQLNQKGNGLDEELDELMEKYDDTKKTEKKTVEKKLTVQPQVSASQVLDMEYKILSGNNLAESSAKADEND